MAGIKFKKYLWLMNTIKSMGPISFDEINCLWKRSSLNEFGDELPKKTFHNHLDAISEIFDIEISCDRRNGYRYYVGDTLPSDRWTRKFLNSLLFRFSLMNDEKMHEAVIDIDNEYDTDDRLYFILACIKTRLTISFTYHRNYASLREGEYKENVPDLFVKHSAFAPLGLVHMDREWYVIGFLLEYGRIVPIELSRMEEISVNHEFVYKDYERFSTREYLESFTYDVLDSDDGYNDMSSFMMAKKFSLWKLHKRQG